MAKNCISKALLVLGSSWRHQICKVVINFHVQIHPKIGFVLARRSSGRIPLLFRCRGNKIISAVKIFQIQVFLLFLPRFRDFIRLLIRLPIHTVDI